MKILFLIDGLLRGGKERQLVELLKGLHEQGNHSLHVGTMNNEVGYPELLELDVTMDFLVRSSRFDLSIVAAVDQLVTTYRPDVVHTWDSMTTFFAIAACKRHKIPLVNGSIRFAASRLWRNPKDYWLQKSLFMMSNAVVANSRAGLETFGKKANTKYHVVYNGYDRSRDAAAEDGVRIRKELGIGSEDLVVTMVASFEPHKDNMTFIRAALQISGTRDDVHFLCVGSGQNLDHCRQVVGLNPHIHFLGRRPDVEAIIQASDIGVLTSAVGIWGEGISNALLEFQSASRPVVATRSGGTPEAILDGCSGFVIPPYDTGALTLNLSTLLDSESSRKNMGTRGQEHVDSTFGMKRMVNDFTALFERVLERSR